MSLWHLSRWHTPLERQNKALVMPGKLNEIYATHNWASQPEVMTRKNLQNWERPVEGLCPFHRKLLTFRWKLCTLKPCLHHTTCCQTGYTTRFDNRLNEQWLFVQHGCQTGLTTVLTTGWMFVYTIQPVVIPVVQPVWQPVVSCKRGIKDHPIMQHQPQTRNTAAANRSQWQDVSAATINIKV